MTLLVQGSLAWRGPEEPLVEDAAVVLDGSRIVYSGSARLAPEAEEEVVGDWFLMPAAVDHHVHIGLADPRAVLAGGVTQVRDLGWPPEDVFPLADISTGTDFDGPAIAACGPIVTAVGGYPTRSSWGPPGIAAEVSGPEEAAAAVAGIAEQDPAAIKVALNTEAGPSLTDAELVAVCEAAHERRLPVVAHVEGPGTTERALGAGVDELAHTPWIERLSEAVVTGLVRRGVRMVSTLDIHSYGKVTPDLRSAVENLFRFHSAGGTVLYGTDLGNGPIPPGIDVREAQHLAAARMDVEEILTAMTAWSLHPGARGDLIALDGNPFEELDALGHVALVVKGGRVRSLEGRGPREEA
ncbi:MAG TPA: amidohydrolase family protein [Actinomycetota bacterium]